MLCFVDAKLLKKENINKKLIDRRLTIKSVIEQRKFNKYVKKAIVKNNNNKINIKWWQKEQFDNQIKNKTNKKYII